MRMQREQTEGFLLVMAASALYGLSPLFITSLSANGAHFSNVMFFKGGISALELAALIALLLFALAVQYFDARLR